MEYTSEKEVLDLYLEVREIQISRLRELLDDRANGFIVTEEQLDEALCFVDNANEAIGKLPTRVKMAQDGTKVVVRTDLRRLANEIW